MPPTVTEFRGEFHDIMVISELRGAYPNVPISADIDYAELIAGESDPMFVTLPIAKVNAKSGNGRYYDEAFVMELMRQTQTQRPVGLMGHMTEAERATAFKPEAVHWVGAVRDGDLIWGKGLVVGEAKARVGRYKASGKSIATSIDAYATGQWDESIKAYRMDASSLKLSQIDLAPSDRAGIPDLARVPMLTTEMQDETLEVEREDSMPPEKTKLEYITEMTVDDARLLPEPVRAAVLQGAPQAPEVKQVQEIRQALGLDDKADVLTTVKEMRQTQDKQRQDEIQARIVEMATPDPKRPADQDKSIKQDAVRGVVVEMVQSHRPATLQEVETVYDKVIASPAVTELLKSKVVQTMGPRQGTPVAGQNGGPKYFDIPADDEDEK